MTTFMRPTAEAVSLPVSTDTPTSLPPGLTADEADRITTAISAARAE